MKDNKVSHLYDSVNLTISDNIEAKSGEISHTTGKNHVLLGMDIEFIARKKVAVSTPHLFEKALEDFCESLKGNVVNTTTSLLFNITSEAKELDKEKRSVITR